MIFISVFGFTALIASTALTTFASPASSLSKTMIDLALAMLVLFRSAGLVTSPVLVTTFSFPKSLALASISPSMKSRVWLEKITTFAFFTFELATASSFKIG